MTNIAVFLLGVITGFAIAIAIGCKVNARQKKYSIEGVSHDLS